MAYSVRHLLPEFHISEVNVDLIDSFLWQILFYLSRHKSNYVGKRFPHKIVNIAKKTVKNCKKQQKKLVFFVLISLFDGISHVLYLKLHLRKILALGVLGRFLSRMAILFYKIRKSFKVGLCCI